MINTINSCQSQSNSQKRIFNVFPLGLVLQTGPQWGRATLGASCSESSVSVHLMSTENVVSLDLVWLKYMRSDSSALKNHRDCDM